MNPATADMGAGMLGAIVLVAALGGGTFALAGEEPPTGPVASGPGGGAPTRAQRWPRSRALGGAPSR